MTAPKPIANLPELIKRADELALDVNATRLPACDCRAREAAVGMPAGVENWCHSHRAQYFASSLARELRALAPNVRR